MPHMYILECDDGTYYTGSTKRLDLRLPQHWAGLGANYTAKHKPVKLVYAEEFARVDEAYYREKHIQAWSHAKKKALVEGKTGELKKNAKKDFSKRKKARMGDRGARFDIPPPHPE